MDRIQAGDIAIYSQWSRLEPRVAQTLVSYLIVHWPSLALGMMLKELNQQPWPRSILVLLRFVQLVVCDLGLDQLILAMDRALVDQPHQLYFIPLQFPYRVTLAHEVEYRTRPYTLSGFIGSQSLLTHTRYPENQTYLSEVQRHRILERLILNKTDFTVKSYQTACAGLVSLRQAQRDLKIAQGIVTKGFTRSRRYRTRVGV